MPSRRTYLSTLAAASLAGCVSTTPDATTDSTTETTTATSTSSRPAVTVEAAAVQYAYRHIESVDWNAIQPADGQFVFVTVDTTDAASVPGRDAFTLIADDEHYNTIDIADTMPVDVDVPGDVYKPEREQTEPRGWLVFDAPAQLDSSPSLQLDGETGSWAWTLSTEKASSPPPAWEWRASAPEAVHPGETFTITVAAENVGDGPGTFRGAVNFSYPLYRPKGFDIPLDPGAAGEATVSASSTNANPGTELTYGIRTPTGRSEVAVTVESAPTATENTN